MKISVKQLNQFGCRELPSIGGCPRAWGFSYLDKLKPDWLAPQLADGIKFHACTASLMSTGRMPLPGILQPGVELTAEEVAPEGHFGRMARAAIIHVLRREYGKWAVEHVGTFPWKTTNGVECSIDLRPDLASDPLGEPTMNYLVDFKSTSNKRYALKSLQNDVQANVYSAGLILLGATCVLGRWIYVDKKTYASWPVEFLFHAEKTFEWVHENVDATIELIYSIREQGSLTALDLPADISVCGGVGRFCDHKDRCLTGPVGPPASRLITLDEVARFIGRNQES
jgi:hypothetical protein